MTRCLADVKQQFSENLLDTAAMSVSVTESRASQEGKAELYHCCVQAKTRESKSPWPPCSLTKIKRIGTAAWPYLAQITLARQSLLVSHSALEHGFLKTCCCFPAVIVRIRSDSSSSSTGIFSKSPVIFTKSYSGKKNVGRLSGVSNECSPFKVMEGLEVISQNGTSVNSLT